MDEDAYGDGWTSNKITLIKGAETVKTWDGPPAAPAGDTEKLDYINWVSEDIELELNVQYSVELTNGTFTQDVRFLVTSKGFEGISGTQNNPAVDGTNVFFSFIGEYETPAGVVGSFMIEPQQEPDYSAFCANFYNTGTTGSGDNETSVFTMQVKSDKQDDFRNLIKSTSNEYRRLSARIYFTNDMNSSKAYIFGTGNKEYQILFNWDEAAPSDVRLFNGGGVIGDTAIPLVEGWNNCEWVIKPDGDNMWGKIDCNLNNDSIATDVTGVPPITTNISLITIGAADNQDRDITSCDIDLLNESTDDGVSWESLLKWK